MVYNVSGNINFLRVELMDYRSEAPEIIKNFLTYHETIKGHSRKTVDEYYLDLRNFFRFMKIQKNLVPRDSELENVSISDIDADFAASVTMNDVYDYLTFLSRDKVRHVNSPSSKRGLNATSRARKVSTIKSFYKYLTVKAGVLEENPVLDLDTPKIMKSLPRFLSLDESKKLLGSVDGDNAVRDYCILTLFLNCGLRISELVGLNITDIHSDCITVLGKGNKQRTVYLNDACVSALNDYLNIRKAVPCADKNALFVSSRKARISKSTVHSLVKNHLERAGLDSTKYSSHKLRHTAATLMLHSGVDVRTLQEILGHENLNTTQIYTHVESENLRRAANMSPLSDFKAEKRGKNEEADEENGE